MTQLRTLGLVTFACVLLAGCSAENGNVQLTKDQQQQVAERIAPVGEVVQAGQVATVSAAATTSDSSARSASDIYNINCIACHGSGVAGAPVLGDAAAWATRLEKGIDTVYANAIYGINAMPAKGTCMNCSDDEIKSTVDYMLDNSR